MQDYLIDSVNSYESKGIGLGNPPVFALTLMHNNVLRSWLVVEIRKC